MRLIDKLSKDYADERYGLSEEEEHQSAEKAFRDGFYKALKLAAEKAQVAQISGQGDLVLSSFTDLCGVCILLLRNQF